MSKKMRKVLFLVVTLTVVVAFVALFFGDKKEPLRNSEWCDTPNIIEKMKKWKWATIRAENARTKERNRMNANEICIQFPEEEPCKAWKSRMECEDEECWEDMEDDWYISEEDVLDCFVPPDAFLSKDDLDMLPGECFDFQSISASKLKSEEKLAQFQVTDMPEGVQKWANKVSLGHVSGIAGGALMIIDGNEELDFLSDDNDLMEVLQTVASVGSEDTGTYEQSAGITVGLYNTLLLMLDQHIANVRQKNSELCESYQGRDLIPARCLLVEAE